MKLAGVVLRRLLVRIGQAVSRAARALKARNQLAWTVLFLGVVFFALIVNLHKHQAWARPLNLFFVGLMYGFVWLLGAVISLVGMCGTVWSLVKSPRLENWLVTSSVVFVTVWFLILEGWILVSVATSVDAQTGPMPLILSRPTVIMMTYGGTFLVAGGILTAKGHRRSTLLETFRILVGVSVIAAGCFIIVTIGFGQDWLFRWLKSNAPGVLLMGMLAPILGLFVLSHLKDGNPRKYRRRAYGADFPGPRRCPCCGARVHVGFRWWKCKKCPHVAPLPREWWVCRCGAPLRGVSGRACPECGLCFERAPFSSVDPELVGTRVLMTDSIDVVDDEPC